MLWQLETWFRTIVYVELKAARQDWERPIKKKFREWPPESQIKDKAQHHMATHHQAGISYLSFGQLWDIIKETDNWPLFEPYFPPMANAVSRMEEVKTIRNRIAHFRDPHFSDVSRLELFMKDMEPGIKKFCERYSGEVTTHSPDAITLHDALKAEWPNIRSGIEMRTPIDWLYAHEPYRLSPRMNATLHLISPHGASPQGVAYKLAFSSGNSENFDIAEFINSTQSVHSKLIHILLISESKAPAVTFPSTHGIAATIELIARLLRAADWSYGSGGWRRFERESLTWPEYILWPEHVLTQICQGFAVPIHSIEDRAR